MCLIKKKYIFLQPFNYEELEQLFVACIEQFAILIIP